MYGYETGSGFGWLTFATTMLGLVAALSIVDGIAAISNSHLFIAGGHYLVGDLHAWGWTVMIIGIIQALAAVGIVLRNQIARWAGVILAIANAVAQLMFIPAYPCGHSPCSRVIHGLVVHGGRSGSRSER